MTSNETWHAEKLGTAAAEALKKNGFDALYCVDREEAMNLLKPWLRRGISVGLGGSMTLKDLGIQKMVQDAGCEFLDQNDPKLDAEGKRNILRRQISSDLYISSSNAVTLDGQLVNVDATGNRVAALIFGPAKTVVIAGINKIVRDVDEALNRIEINVAPRNNQRLNRKNPCVESGVCMDCDEDTRLCRVYSVLRKKPGGSDFTVIIVGEPLGY